MPRITSSTLRRMILATGGPLSSGENPEQLELYQADGTPLDITRDNTKMRWRGPWQGDESYVKNDVVIDEGDLFILSADSAGAGAISPYEENIDPSSIIHTRKSFNYAFAAYDFENTPIITRDVPFTDLASAPVANIFIGGGSRIVSFDIEPTAKVTITTTGSNELMVYQDTGASGPGNSAINGINMKFSPYTFRGPEGIRRISVELNPAVTSVTVSGLGASYDRSGEVDWPLGGMKAVPLRNGTRAYPSLIGEARFYFDLATGGTVTITDPTTTNEYTKLFNAEGTELAVNFYGPGTFGSSLVAHDLPPGRYFFFDQDAIYNDPPDLQPTVTLSDGATFVALPEGVKYWDVLFRASSGPAGPQGPKGDKGDTGNAGPAGAATTFLDAFAGDYVEGPYAAGKVVRYGNGLYMAAVAVDALSTPGASANWKLLVQGV